MTRILQVVDDALAASAKANARASAETATVKQAAELPRGEIAQGLRRVASSLREESDVVTYDDLTGGAR